MGGRAGGRADGRGEVDDHTGGRMSADRGRGREAEGAAGQCLNQLPTLVNF